MNIASGSTATVLVIAGAQDMTATPALRDFQRRYEGVVGGPCRALLVDLRGVEAADSKLLACLVDLVSRCRARGTQLDLRPSTVVETWIHVFRLEGILSV